MIIIVLPQDGASLLHDAAGREQLAVIEYLLERDADVHLTDKEGDPAFYPPGSILLWGWADPLHLSITGRSHAASLCVVWRQQKVRPRVPDRPPARDARRVLGFLL
jgi:hypothetical protein